MLFPTASLHELRRQLFARMKSGAITEEQAFGQALEADPMDALSLASLGLVAEDAGDLDKAEDYARRCVRVRPCAPDPYAALGRILGKRDPTSQLANAYSLLALEKLRYDKEGLAHFDVEGLARRIDAEILLKRHSREEAYALLIEGLKRKPGDEPADVTLELEPHRLIHALQEACGARIDRGVVDGILRNRRECAPLLLGILKEFAECRIEDREMVEKALVLLGEMGDVESLPALAEFLELDEDLGLINPAGWAFRRIIGLDASEATAKLREMIRETGAVGRVMLAQEIALSRDVVDAAPLLAAITEGIENFPFRERESVVVGAIAAAHQVEGRNSPLAASLERRHGGTISRKSRQELRDLRDQMEMVNALTPAGETLTIYEICCERFDEPEKDPGEARPDGGLIPAKPFVHQRRAPGRNDPCWCGSGKKYKKCHLDEDSHT